jgi:hypothetical protein
MDEDVMKKLLVLFPLLAATTAFASPGRFGPDSARVTNPWFPLKAGTTYVYSGTTDGRPSSDVFKVTRAVAVVNGVPCAVIDDRVYVEDRLTERTTDWYAQDRAGNVWYLGEATAELDKAGHVIGTEGSWQAGRDGAKAGIFMPADPRVGYSFRQEFYRGHAEDYFRVLERSKQTLLTEEWSPLEPAVLDHKFYKRGVGMVREASVRGGAEKLVLVSVRKGAA